MRSSRELCSPFLPQAQMRSWALFQRQPRGAENSAGGHTLSTCPSPRGCQWITLGPSGLSLESHRRQRPDLLWHLGGRVGRDRGRLARGEPRDVPSTRLGESGPDRDRLTMGCRADLSRPRTSRGRMRLNRPSFRPPRGAKTSKLTCFTQGGLHL